MARSKARIPAPAGGAIKRGMHPDDLVGALPLLASSDSDFATRWTINVDGGAIARQGRKNA